MERLLLIVPTTSYRTEAFLEAAERAGVPVAVASDRCDRLNRVWKWPQDSLVIDFYEPERSVRTIVKAGRERPFRAIVPAGGEQAALVAAMASQALGLPFNAVEAARATTNKHAMLERLTAGGVPSPRWFLTDLTESSADVAGRAFRETGWPCVVKPLLLSASRGVIRADDPRELAAALDRLRTILRCPELLEMAPVASQQILVESFVPGAEVALEGLMDRGTLRTLALFDKPDPLDGPFFEETIYVTPSRHPADVQRRIQEVTAAAAAALGLATGPVHAELRLSPDGPVVIEIAARSIGGLCSRVLRFGAGMTLEELIVRHALGQDVTAQRREAAAGGVMMLPIPRRGVLREVRGVEDARAVPGIEDVVITIDPGREVVPLPEGSSYLGFVFARGESPGQVEESLRAAHRALDFDITTVLPVA